MKSAKLQKMVSTVRASLNWPVTEKTHEQDEVRIVSYPYTQTHTVLQPKEGASDEYLLQYLHELGRATLCETVHPVFAGVYFFSNHSQKKLLLPVVPALNAACDWFVGSWLLKQCPAEARESLAEQLEVAEEVAGGTEIPPVDIFLHVASLIAQSIRSLDAPIDCGGLLKTAVDAFLAVSPDQPSAAACHSLVNRLLATYSNQQIRIIDDGAYGLWEVTGPDADPQAVGSTAGPPA